MLKDPEKRKLYDQLGPDWEHGQHFQRPPGFENMHFHFGGGGPGGGMGGGMGGGPGAAGFSDFFENIFGGGGGFGGFSPGAGGGRGAAGASAPRASRAGRPRARIPRPGWS